MILTNFSVKRPIASFAFIIVLILAGLNSYNKIGLNNMPDIEVPYITITTIYPGASPEEIEVDVAKKIEDAVSNLDGIKHIDSTCMENMCLTILEFQLGVDVDVAGTDVREQVSLVVDDFPQGVESPKILKFDLNSKPVVTILLYGDMPLDQIYDYAENNFSDQLSVQKGVAEVQIAGGAKLEVQLIIDREKLSAYGLNSLDILSSLSSDNKKIPAGNISRYGEELSISFDSEFKNLIDIKNKEIKTKGKGRLYLKDIAEIKFKSKKKRTLAFYNGQPAVNVKIIKKGEANSVKVVNRVKEAVKQLQNSNGVPGGIKIVNFTDDGEFIQASVDDAWSSIFLGVILTGIILFLFLHEVRSTIIVIITIPVSIIIVFSVINFYEFTFNNSTLLALGTSVGVLVTNSIVVIENIMVKIHSGLKPKEGAIVGTSQVFIPVLASALTNVVVFLPIATMSTIVGKYFVPFAITMTGITVISLFITFTLTPMLSGLLLRDKMKHNWIMRIYTNCWNYLYGKLESFYKITLNWTAKYPLIFIIIVFVTLFTIGGYIIPKVGMSFFPDNDRGEFIIKVEYPTNYNLENTTDRTLEIEKGIRKLPEVLSTSMVIGKVQGTIGQVSEGVHLAEITVKTTQKKERSQTMNELREMLREHLSDNINCIITVNVPGMVGGSESNITLKISGDDLNELNRLGLKAIANSSKTNKFSEIDSSIRADKPEIKILPKKAILNDIGFSTDMLGLLLRTNIEGTEVGTYKIGDRSLDIRVKFKEEKGEKQIKEFVFMSKNGKPLSLETVAKLKESSIPIQISRSEKQRIIKLFANQKETVALGDGVNILDKEINEILPSGYSMSFTGKIEKMAAAQADFLQAIIIASILTYLLIAGILESWSLPFIILLTLPLAIVGLFSGLYLTGQSLSMMGLLGAVMLIGIVVNNAILVIDNVMHLRENKGLNAKDAMIQSAIEKFQPIVMTSLAAIIGMLPMALGNGLGSELRSSCGITVVGGLLTSTLLSLYIIPLVYIKFAKNKKKVSK